MSRPRDVLLVDLSVAYSIKVHAGRRHEGADTRAQTARAAAVGAKTGPCHMSDAVVLNVKTARPVTDRIEPLTCDFSVELTGFEPATH